MDSHDWRGPIPDCLPLQEKFPYQISSILYMWTPTESSEGVSVSRKKTLNASFLCVWQPAPCCPEACGRAATTCQGWSQAPCLSLATGPCSLTVARPAAVLGAAAMNRKLHRWVFGVFFPLRPRRKSPVISPLERLTARFPTAFPHCAFIQTLTRRVIFSSHHITKRWWWGGGQENLLLADV